MNTAQRSLVVLILSFPLVALAGEFQPDSNTVALWHFNEGVGDTVYDASGNGNIGVVYGADWVGGLFGNGLYFDGDDTVLVFDSPSLKPDSELTIEAYIRPDTNTWGAILSKWIYPQLGPGYGFGVDIPNVGGTISTTSGYYNNISIPYSFNWNQDWYHLKLYYREPFVYLFINDSLLGTVSATGLLVHNNLNLTIGVRNDGGPPDPDGFKGIIDEIRISKIARVNRAPILDTIEAKTVSEVSHLFFSVYAADPDKEDSIILTAENLPNNSSFVDSGNGTGIFSFDPDTTQAGIYQVMFIASDGILADSETVEITVNDCVAPGDVNGIPPISLPDVIHLVNYVFDKDRPATNCLGSDLGNCWSPMPECRGEVNGSPPVGLPDVIHVVNYVFDKDRPATSCLGSNPGNCWTPVPSGACCLPVP